MNRRESFKVAATSLIPVGIENLNKSVDAPITIWKNNRGSRLVIDNKDYGAWYVDDSWWVDCNKNMVRIGTLVLDKPLLPSARYHANLLNRTGGGTSDTVQVLGSFLIEEIKNEKGHEFRIIRALSGSVMKVRDGGWEPFQDVCLRFGKDYKS